MNGNGRISYSEFMHAVEHDAFGTANPLAGTGGGGGSDDEAAAASPREALTAAIRGRVLERFEGLRAAFVAADTDGSGSVDDAELATCVRLPLNDFGFLCGRPVAGARGMC